MLDLDSFLVSLYVLVDDWWKADHPSTALRKPGRPALLSESEVLTLAILAQWPRLSRVLRARLLALRFFAPWPLLPHVVLPGSAQGRRIRALEPELRELQLAFARELACPSAVYRVMDTTLVPAIVRVRASRKGLFCGQASFGRSASKTEWIYGLKVALVVDPDGVITAFGLPCGLRRETHRRRPPGLRPLRGLPGRQGLHGGRVGAPLDGDLRSACCGHPQERFPPSVVEGRIGAGLLASVRS
jgi:hypothetical protein